MKKLLLTKLPLLLGLLLVAQAWLHAQELKIHQINVGKGLCTYIEVFNAAGIKQTNSTMLIDAGLKEQAATIRTYLNGVHNAYLAASDQPNTGKVVVNKAIVTHYDKDHLGGFVGTNSAQGLLERGAQPAIEFTRILDRGSTLYTPTSATYNEYIQKITDQNYDDVRETPGAGSSEVLFQDANFRIEAHYLAVNGNTNTTVIVPSDDPNVLSIVTLVRVLDRTNSNNVIFSYLNAGDYPGIMLYNGKRKRDEDCVNPTSTNDQVGNSIKGKITTLAGGRISVMTASHHGAYNALVDVSSAATGTNIGTILVSSGNSGYEHPHLSFFRCLANLNVGSVWMTDHDRFERLIELNDQPAIQGILSFNSATGARQRHHIVASFKRNSDGTISKTIKRVNSNGMATIPETSYPLDAVY